MVVIITMTVTLVHSSKAASSSFNEVQKYLDSLQQRHEQQQQLDQYLDQLHYTTEKELDEEEEFPSFLEADQTITEYGGEDLMTERRHLEVDPEAREILDFDADASLAELESRIDEDMYDRESDLSEHEEPNAFAETDSDSNTETEAQADADSDSESDAENEVDAEEANVIEQHAVNEARTLAESEFDSFANEIKQQIHDSHLARPPPPAQDLGLMEVSASSRFSPEDAAVHKTAIGGLRAKRLRSQRLQTRHLIDPKTGHSEEAEDIKKYGVYDEREAIEAKKEYDPVTIEGMTAQRLAAVGALRPIGQTVLPFCGTYPFCKDAPAPPRLNGLPPAPNVAIKSIESAKNAPLQNLPRKIAELKKDPVRFQMVFQNIYDRNHHNEPLRNHMGKK